MFQRVTIKSAGAKKDPQPTLNPKTSRSALGIFFLMSPLNLKWVEEDDVPKYVSEGNHQVCGSEERPSTYPKPENI